MAIYDGIGEGYARRRRPDERIQAAILSALGDAQSVVNVGAGAGSYEPADRRVLAIEPSQTMIDQRPAGAAPCLKGCADALPVATGSHDAAMAILTLHHWPDWRAGLAEMRRVARRRIVVLTFDAETSDFWLTRDYFPEIAALDREIMPRLHDLAHEPGQCRVTPLPVPHDCIDGFLGAYWRRPDVYLEEAARGSMSSFARFDAGAGLRRLADDLASGAWMRRYGWLMQHSEFDVGYRLVQWEL